jgi:hypothetical protein
MLLGNILLGKRNNFQIYVHDTKHTLCRRVVEIRVVAVRGPLQQLLHEAATLMMLDLGTLESLR